MPDLCPVCSQPLEVETARDFTGVSTFFWCPRCREYAEPVGGSGQTAEVTEREGEREMTNRRFGCAQEEVAGSVS